MERSKNQFGCRSPNARSRATYLSRGGSSGADLEITLVPTGADKKPSATILLRALSVDNSFQQCMEYGLCTGTLIKQGSAGYKLRQSSKLQIECLLSKYTPEVKAACEEWKKCLPKPKQDMLIAMLTAAKAGKRLQNALVEIGVAGSLSQFGEDKVMTDEEGSESKFGEGEGNDAKDATVIAKESCLDPAVDDPEAWECACMKAMVEVCGGVDSACFHKKMCEYKGVCKEWQDEHCENGLLLASISARAEQNKTPASLAQGQLDTSLRGKCMV